MTVFASLQNSGLLISLAVFMAAMAIFLFGALIISLFPLVMFGILFIVAPSYYGDIWGSPLITPVFVIFGLLALLGDFIMFRMVNFDF